MQGKCTVYFEDPFWVGIFERIDEEGYSAARFVFGAEPTEAELHQWALRQDQPLTFSASGKRPAPEETEAGFKRRQREARRHMAQEGIGTYAQRVLRAEREQMKQTRRELSREEREAQEQHRFQQKQARKKEKHRGH